MKDDAEHDAAEKQREFAVNSKLDGDAIVEIGKQIKHLLSIENEKIQKHLQVESISDVASVSSILSKYQQFVQTAVLEDYLKEQGFQIVEKAQFEAGEEGQHGAQAHGLCKRTDQHQPQK